MTLWNEFAGCETSFVAGRGGIRTRIVLGGPEKSDRRPVLMLHGRGGHLETFRYNLPEIAKTRTAIAVDLLGHGLTAQSGTTYSVAEIARHLGSLVTELDDGRGFDLVGQSLGAWAGILAALAGAPLHHMALIEPAGFQPHGDRMADDGVKKAFQQGGRAFRAPTTETVRLRFAQLLHNPAACDDEMVELRRRLYSLPGAADVHQAVRRADNDPHVITAEQLRRLGRPLLLIRGEHGHIPLPVFREAAGAVEGSVVTSVSNAKQWPHYEQPRTVNKHIIDHFER